MLSTLEVEGSKWPKRQDHTLKRNFYFIELIFRGTQTGPIKYLIKESLAFHER